MLRCITAVVTCSIDQPYTVWDDVTSSRGHGVYNQSAASVACQPGYAPTLPSSTYNTSISVNCTENGTWTEALNCQGAFPKLFYFVFG